MTHHLYDPSRDDAGSAPAACGDSRVNRANLLEGSLDLQDVTCRRCRRTTYYRTEDYIQGSNAYEDALMGIDRAPGIFPYRTV